MATNKDIMNLVRESAPASYKERIPQATQQNLTETINAILEYPIWPLVGLNACL